MKKKDILILTLTPAVLVILIISWFIFQFNKAAKEFSLIGTNQLTQNVYCVKGKIVNVFFIKTNTGKYISIDAGDEPDLIKQGMEQLYISADDVAAVFLTHSDFDHVGSLALFKNAKVYISEKEEDIMTGREKRSLFFKNKMLPVAYIKLKENETITIDKTTVKGIPSYGHTSGSFSYLVDNKILFTGDNLILKNSEVYTFPKFFTMNIETQKDSIRKLAALENIEYLFTAHSGYTENFNFAMKNWK